MDEKTFSDRMFFAARQVGKTMRLAKAWAALFPELQAAYGGIAGNLVNDALVVAAYVRRRGGASVPLVRRVFDFGDAECSAALAWLAEKGVISTRWLGRGRAEMVPALRRGVDDVLWQIVKEYFQGGYGRPVLTFGELYGRYRGSSPGLPVRAWIHRGTGRTTEQMKMAPKGAIFIWVCDDFDYPRRLARMLGRTDLRIKSPRAFRTHELSGWTGAIVVDHAANLSARDADWLAIWRNRQEMRRPARNVVSGELRGNKAAAVIVDECPPDWMNRPLLHPRHVEALHAEVFRSDGGDAYVAPSHGPLRGVAGSGACRVSDDSQAESAGGGMSDIRPSSGSAYGGGSSSGWDGASGGGDAGCGGVPD